MALANQVIRILRDEEGATAVEYGLIVSLIIIGLVAVMGEVATETINLWTKVENDVTTARTP